MQAAYITQGAAGFSSWIPVDSFLNSPGVALGCSISSGGSLTYKVQHTFDNFTDYTPVGLTRSTTTATMVFPSHGLTTNDSIVVIGAGAPFDGTYAVASVTDANTITYTVANSGATAAQGRCVRTRVFDHASITGKTANSDGNYAYPITACRINITAYTGGNVTLAVRQGG